MTVRRITSVAAVLVAANLVLAQGAPPKDQPKKDTPAKKEPAKPAPGSLEDTLEKALRNSADIKAAESKVRDAEAELNRVRQQVLTRATTVHTDLNLAKRMLAVAEQALVIANNRGARVGKDGGTEAIDARTDAILAAEAMVAKHRGEVEKLETELKSLRGEFAIKSVGVQWVDDLYPDVIYFNGKNATGTVRLYDPLDTTIFFGGLKSEAWINPAAGPAKAAAVQAPMAERIRKWLDQEFKGAYIGAPIAEALESLRTQSSSEVPVRMALHGQRKDDAKIEMEGTMPIGAWLQVIEDTDPEIRILVRDYGLLVTTKDRIPEGAARAVDFWKAKETRPKEDKKSAEKK